MTVVEQYRECAAKGMTVCEIAKMRGVTPQAVRWADRRYGLRIKRDRGRASVLAAEMTAKQREDFRLLLSQAFTMKEALASIGRADLAERLK